MIKSKLGDLLAAWAGEMQGIEADWAGDQGTFDNVANVNATVRTAAAQLPFETEPASFVALLERLAPSSVDPRHE